MSRTSPAMSSAPSSTAVWSRKVSKFREHGPARGDGKLDALPVAVDGQRLGPALDDFRREANAVIVQDVEEIGGDPAGAVVAALLQVAGAGGAFQAVLFDDREPDIPAEGFGGAEGADGEKRPGRAAAHDRHCGPFGEGLGSASPQSLRPAISSSK
jgi:hypothetical protein